MIGVTTTLRKISGMKKRIRAIKGGQGASKTFSILMIIINHCSSKPGKRCIIASEELSKMRTNIIADFIKILTETNIFDNNRWNSSECIYKFPNGSTIKFMGSDKIAAGKGTRTDILFVNECNKVPFEFYRELSTRSKNIFLDWNPNIACWVDTEVIPRDDCETLTVTFRDNEFLSEEEKNEILRYKQMAFNEDGSVKSDYWYNIYLIYSEGQVGHFVGAILTNIETGEFDTSLPYVHSLDIGWKDDDAMTKVAIDNKNKRIYVDEIIYQNNLSSSQLSTLIKSKIGSDLVVCDSAAAKTIADLKENHINAVSCKKNRIVEDIKSIQGYTIVVTKTSTHLLQELNNWRWKDVDGKSIPEDGEIHLIDALRYGFAYLSKPPVNPSSVVVTKTSKPNRFNKTFSKYSSKRLI